MQPHLGDLVELPLKPVEVLFLVFQVVFDQFARSADDYRKKAREYWRCLRDAPAKARAANGKIDPEKLPPCPDGRSRDVVSKYNEFIRTSNDHQFP